MAGVLPSGDVTFVFSDVEASTVLLRDLGASRYEAALAEHRRLLADAIERHGGHWIRTAGDGTFCVFADPAAALRACVDAQASFAEHGWEVAGGRPLRVRIGLHHGREVPPSPDDDYVHLAVHQAARISAVANGGQVLVAGELAAVAEASGLDVLALGAYRLRDFDVAPQLFAIGGPGIAPMTAAPRAIRAEAGNLPRSRTSFVGREVEVREAVKLLEEHPIVTVTGPGGVGKTRLAVEAAAAQRRPVVFVDLGPAPAHADVLLLIARQAGVDEGAADLLAATCDRLGETPTLVVLDCCEAAIDGAATAVDQLLDRLPLLRVLATSREPLRLDGEVVQRLAPLALPPAGASSPDALLATDAVRLLVARAAAAGIAVDLDAGGAAISSICRRLDGIPLALELAAGRLGELEPAELDQLLDERFAVLDQGRRTAPERQRTLEAMVAWSYDRISADDRAALRRLSVLRGSFPEGAAIALGAAQDLDRLVQVSLVEAGADGRFRLLDTIHAFAAGALATDPAERSDAEIALVEWCTDTVGSPVEDDTVIAEHDNLLAALEATGASADQRLALAHRIAPAWQRRGRAREGLPRVLALVDQCEAVGVDPVRTARVREQAAHLAKQVGRDELVLDLLAQAIPVLAEHGDDKTLFSAEYMRAQTVMDAGDAVAADAALASALAAAERLGDPFRQADVLAGQGRLLAARGRPAEGVAAAARAVETLRAAPPGPTLASCLDLLGLLHGLNGDMATGLTFVQEGLAVARSLGDDAMADEIAVDVAQLAVQLGDRALALSILDEVIPRLRERGDAGLLAGCHLTLANLLVAADPARSRVLAEDAAAGFLRVGHLPGAASAWDVAETAAAVVEDWVAAVELSTKAVEARRRVSSPADLGHSLTRLARAELRRGEPGAALDLLVEAIAATRAPALPADPAAAAIAVEVLPELIDELGAEMVGAAFAPIL